MPGDVERCTECGLDPCGCYELGLDPATRLPDVPPSMIEWPITAARVADGVAAIFLARRAELRARHGDMACTDLSRSPLAIASDAHQRLLAIVECLGSAGSPVERAELSLPRAETAGALLFSLYERLQMELGQ